jgi:hypothetical protein
MMETYKGVLSLRLMNEGSKSEAVYAYLTLESGEERMLCRQDVFPANDKYFVPYDGKTVCVTGDLYDDELIVEAVQIAEEPTAQKCQDSAPKKVKVCSAKKCRKQQLTLYALMKNRRT